MGAFNACPMAIGVLERICALSAFALQTVPASAPLDARSACAESFLYKTPDWGKPYNRVFRKLHLYERFAGILDGCPARTDPALWTGLGFPIDVEVREVVAGLSLIPVGLERRTNQVHLIARLALDEISDRDVACIDEMLLGEQFFLSQVGMDRGEDSLIAQGSSSGLDMSDQLWSIFITRLGKMHFISEPDGGPLLAIARVKVIGGVDELSGR